MSICNFPACTNSNTWYITDQGDTPLIFKPFYVCHEHLSTEERCSKIYDELVKARYENIVGNSFSHSRYTFAKSSTNWEKLSLKCSKCDKTNNLWKKIESQSHNLGYNDICYIPTIFCNEHLEKSEYGPSIAHGNRDTGVRPIEPTWV